MLYRSIAACCACLVQQCHDVALSFSVSCNSWLQKMWIHKIIPIAIITLTAGQIYMYSHSEPIHIRNNAGKINIKHQHS